MLFFHFLEFCFLPGLYLFLFDGNICIEKSWNRCFDTELLF